MSNPSPPIGSKSHPAPLDAFSSAKPDEPIFTLQGGDPLAWPLVVLWAHLARVRCGIISPCAIDTNPVINAALEAELPGVSEQGELLTRATEAEKVSWSMKAYLAGQLGAEPSKTPVEKFSELDRLDIYDIRRRTTSSISAFISELSQFRAKLTELKFLEPRSELDNFIEASIMGLKSVERKIEVRTGSAVRGGR